LPLEASGDQPPRHEMILEETQASGVEVWYCPECGRRSAMRWLPEYDRVVLEPGDGRVVHVGGTGGVRTGRVGDVWRRWLADHGIDWDATAG
jgi:hypothetical protein